MNETKTEEVLAEARQLMTHDPQRALDLYENIIEDGQGPGWSHAQLEVAEHEFGHARFQSAVNIVEAILDAPSDKVEPFVRGAAGILWSEGREMLDLEIDEPLLLQSIDVVLAHKKRDWAGAGLMHLSRRQVLRGERSEAKATILRAVDLYDDFGSVTGGPSALQRLAKLELEDGNHDEARRHLDRGIAYLRKFPLGGTLARLLEQRLSELRDKISPP